MRSVQFHNVARPPRRRHPLRMPNETAERGRTFIKEWREFRGHSQEALAELIGMSKGNLSLLERGLINYTQDTLERLAAALDCGVADLLTRDPQDSEELFTMWSAASQQKRRTFIEIGKTILKEPGE